jgi:hypothetical protein
MATGSSMKWRVVAQPARAHPRLDVTESPTAQRTAEQIIDVRRAVCQTAEVITASMRYPSGSMTKAAK